MNTYRELIYFTLDKLKLSSDDSYFTEEHILFLLNKYRNLLLQTQYKNKESEIPESYFQTLCLNLIEVPAIPEEPCEGGVFLRSEKKIPSILPISKLRIDTGSFFIGDIIFVSNERMKYVGYNRWLPNIIYASLGPDKYLYFKSFNPQFLYLEKVRVTGIFEEADKAAELLCDKEEVACDILDTNFPIEDALVPQLIEVIVKSLQGPEYAPEDKNNDANDNLSEVTVSRRRNG